MSTPKSRGRQRYTLACEGDAADAGFRKRVMDWAAVCPDAGYAILDTSGVELSALQIDVPAGSRLDPPATSVPSSTSAPSPVVSLPPDPEETRKMAEENEQDRARLVADRRQAEDDAAYAGGLAQGRQFAERNSHGTR